MPLTKDFLTTFIPGDPGNPGNPYIPAQPARSVIEPVEVCTDGVTVISVPTGNPLHPFTYFSVLTGHVVCSQVPTLVHYPAKPAIPAVPYRAPTAQQYLQSTNTGWTGDARSIDPLVQGHYLEFAVKAGSQGVLIALGDEGRDGYPIGYYQNGIIVDLTGAYVFESGVVKHTLSATQTATLRINRLSDGRIFYSSAAGSYLSTVAAYSNAETLYAYAVLYTSGDEVSSYAFTAGDLLVEPSPISMHGVGSLVALSQPLALMTSVGTLVAESAPGVVMDATATLDVVPSIPVIPEIITMSGVPELITETETGGVGIAVMRAFESLGGDYDYGIGRATLPYFTSTASEEGFVPEAITYGYANLPYFSSHAEGSEDDAGDGTATLPYFLSLGGDYAYGFGAASLPEFMSFAYGSDFTPDDTILLLSTGVTDTPLSLKMDIVLTLTSRGAVASVLTMTRQQVLQLISEGTAESSLSILGIYGFTLLSDMRGVSLQSLSVNDRPDLHESGVVWVVNTDTKASSQYEQYGFNSFFTRNGVNYGVSGDGIYKLEGDTDAGADIQALAVLPKTDFGDAHIKYVHNFYLGVSSEGKMILKVDVDGQVYYYTARSSSEDLKNHRVDIGRGLRGTYWQPTILNKDGADFNLASIEFTPLLSNRKI